MMEFVSSYKDAAQGLKPYWCLPRGGTALQAAETLASLKGTAFRPYIDDAISRALAPGGIFPSRHSSTQWLKPFHFDP